MAQTVLTSLDEVRAAVGRHLGTSDWLVITDDRLGRFAAATGGGDHGHLALALTNLFLPQIVEVRGRIAGRQLRHRHDPLSGAAALGQPGARHRRARDL
jgi:hypothetical protein